MSYTLLIHNSAAKTIKSLDRTTINRIYRRLKELSQDPLNPRLSAPVEMSQEEERKSGVGD